MKQGINFSNLKTTTRNIFFTSDLHLNHENIIGWCGRPFKDIEEMNQAIIDNWNKVVGKNDIVFDLGDFCFGGSAEWKKFTESLNGIHVLIPGNHDWKNRCFKHKDFFYEVRSQYFVTVDGQQIWLSHFPFLTWSGKERGVWNLHGHVHLSTYKNTGIDYETMKTASPTQYDVGTDWHQFTPVSFQQVKEAIERQIKDNTNQALIYASFKSME